MGKQGIKSFIEVAPRWLLVLLASGGLYLMKQKFDNIETSIVKNASEIQELKIISARLATIIDNRREWRQ